MNNPAQNLSEIADSSFFEEQTSQTIGKKFVVFYIGDELFAVAAEKISEVFEPLEITALPNVPEWLLGVCNLRGEIISVINLPKLWQTGAQTNFTKSKLIILRGQKGAIALATNKLSKIISLPDSAIEPCEKNSHISAKAVHNAKNINIVDAEKLF